MLVRPVPGRESGMLGLTTSSTLLANRRTLSLPLEEGTPWVSNSKGGKDCEVSTSTPCLYASLAPAAIFLSLDPATQSVVWDQQREILRSRLSGPTQN